MNSAHVHLWLNHIPTIGFSVGVGLLIVAIGLRSDDLKRTSLAFIFLMALLTIATYLSGNAAQIAIAGQSKASEVLIRKHETAALWGFLSMEITGFIAWLGLWQFRRKQGAASWNVPTVLILSIFTFVIMARASNVGGEIRHPEIGSSQTSETSEPASDRMARLIGAYVTENPWVWPACETVHFIGLCLLFAVVLLVDLRILGMAKALSFAGLYRLLPWGILGFGINLATGMLFFIATPQQYTKNVMFYWKIILIILAGINALYFMLSDEPWSIEAGVDAPLRAKFVAASAIFLWLGVLFCGHMLPFLGNSF